MLLDLMHYQHDDIVQHSLLLLDRHYSSKSEIFKMALELQLLVTDESIAVYDAVEGLLAELNKYLKEGSVRESSIARSSPIQVLTKYCYLEGEVEGYEPHQINQKMIIGFGRTSYLQYL